MALTAEEQNFYDFAKASLPDWIPDQDEFLMGAAKMFGGVKALHDYLFGQALIGTATGATATTPDWLNQHARDRGTSRQLTETDPALRERLRNAPDALTRSSILAAIDAVLVAEGITDGAALVELPRHGAHSGAYVSDTGVGGTFALVGGVLRFTPTAAWARAPYWDPVLVPRLPVQLVISGAADPANDGAWNVTGLDGDAAILDTPAGVAGADAGVTWTVRKLPRSPSSTVEKTGGVNGVRDAGVSSIQQIVGDGYVEATFGGAASVRVDFGLAPPNSGLDRDSGYFLEPVIAAGNTWVREFGVDKGEKTVAAVGDRLRVERVGTTILYKKNGVTVYTSLTPSSGPLIADFSFLNSNTSYAGVVLVDAGQPVAISWENIVNVTATNATIDGFARAYSQRGYRSAVIAPPRLVVILPFGTTAATEASVR